MTAAETWHRFRIESEGCSARLSSELRQCWKSLHELMLRQAAAFDRACQVKCESGLLDSLHDIFNSQANALLIEPVGQFRRERFQQRVMEAFTRADGAMESVIGAMPESASFTASDWIALAGTAGMSASSRLKMSWARKPIQVSFRRNLSSGFRRQRAERIKLEGRLMRLLAECGVELTLPWQAALQSWLPAVFSESTQTGSLRTQCVQFRHRLTVHESRATQILNEMDSLFANNAHKIANRYPLKSRTERAREESARETKRYFQRREFWTRQSRAVESDMEMELGLVNVERAIVQSANELFSSIEVEHRSLLTELVHVVNWLESWPAGEGAAFPSDGATIVSSRNRLSMWTQSIGLIVDDLPHTVEVVSRVDHRFRWPSPFRTQTPRLILSEAMQRQSEAVILDGLERLESQHWSIVREIQRAREVVSFAAETAREGSPGDLQIEREGIENARSLLEFHRTQTQDVPPEVEKSIGAALATGFLRTHTQLELGQFGVAQQAARHGLPAAALKLFGRVLHRLRAGSKLGARGAAGLYRETLIRIGWSPAPTARMAHVVERGYLSLSLGTELSPDRLPMIYQRLFRLAPIEDSRFLIGRQNEMRALAEARHLWEQNRDAAVIIVGERGSGKTSLVNSAVRSTFADLNVIRADFSSRLTRKEEMYDFLGNLLEVDPKEVERALSSNQRVVILEELERTYLRRIHNFEALRALLNLISKTSKHTLWIISTNYFAFRLLNASLRLDPHFSHRINAMAVDWGHLREAILLRHNLSGLRLRFAPTPAGTPYGRRIKKLVGVEADGETEFFDMLYRESGGVFRTAFALWQRFIDRVEGGIVYMRYPAAPGSEKLIQSLTDLDLFTLAAILQHGSLTPREHSIIFQVDLATSNAWLDNLLARELIEPDPAREGLRVVPEAGEIVRGTLFSRNIA